MSDRFPYNLPSREALVELIRRSEKRPSLKDNLVTFEDMFYSPTTVEPGRTSIEMVDLQSGFKKWFDYRRLDLGNPRCLGPLINLKVMGEPTPAKIAEEINRSRKMTFGPSDVSFSEEIIPYKGDTFEYDLVALTGSYAYYGKTKIMIEVIPTSQWTRYLENGSIRYTEAGIDREIEHKLTRWS